MEALFAHEPFKGMRDRFNIVAVKSPSKESGASEPGKGIWKNTALHSHWDTNYSERYLTTSNLKDMHDLLAGTPYEHILVLVNSERYGGGGILNSYLLSTIHNKWSKPVVVHEFGHSFAGLADEYAYENEEVNMYPLDVEPWEKNITTKVNFKGKWEEMIGKKPGVGLVEGGGYKMKGVYRACNDCRMRTNEIPEFCPACQRHCVTSSTSTLNDPSPSHVRQDIPTRPLPPHNQYGAYVPCLSHDGKRQGMGTTNGQRTVGDGHRLFQTGNTTSRCLSFRTLTSIIGSTHGFRPTSACAITMSGTTSTPQNVSAKPFQSWKNSRPRNAHSTTSPMRKAFST